MKKFQVLLLLILSGILFSFVPFGVNKTRKTIDLEVVTFKNGDTITYIEDPKLWEKACNEGQAAWCYADGTKGKKKPLLYNWFAVNDKRGLAPVGYRILKSDDWKKMIDLKELVPFSGFRNCFGNYHDTGTRAYWWSFDDHDGSNSAWAYSHDNNTHVLKLTSELKGCAMMVRCIED